MIKKTLTLIIIILMLVSCISITAYAENIDDSYSVSVITLRAGGGGGSGGGGGGVPGGAGGAFVSHEHDETVCGYHTHLGNTTSGGECYQDQTQSTAICGSTFIEPGPCRLWWDAAALPQPGPYR